MDSKREPITNVKEVPEVTIRPLQRAVTMKEASPAAIEDAFLPTEKRIRQAVWGIVFSVALPCIPIIVITVVLLYIIYKHQVHLSPGFEGLAPAPNNTHVHRTAASLITLIRKEGFGAAYYVKYNPSTITTIASWTSRIIPYLSSSIMALVAFHAARHIVVKSKRGDEHGSGLPTPTQLTLLISLLGGSGFSPLKDALMHRFYRKEKLVAPLPMAFTALFIITFLGLIIPIIDSWFGIATKAVVMTQLVPKSVNISSYGRQLSPTTCPAGPRDNGSVNYLNPDNDFWPCNIPNINGHGGMITSPGEATRILYGVSPTNQVLNYTDETGRFFYYLADPAQNAEEDFQTVTIATSAQCVPMTQLCYYNYDATDYGQLFNCTRAFSGNLHAPNVNTSARAEDLLYNSNVGMAFAGNPQLTEVGKTIFMADNGFWYPGQTQPVNYSLGWNETAIYATNPLYYGAWAYGYPSPDLFSADPVTFAGDTGIYYDNNAGQGGSWLMNCSTTVWHVNYKWVNGAVQRFNATMASPDFAGMMSAPLAWKYKEDAIGDALTVAAQVAGLSGNNSRIIGKTFAEQVGKAMLAFSVTAFEPVRNELEQQRIAGMSLARIPLAPLFLLLATKAIYVIAVIVLAVGAYCFTHPAETEVVKAQLSVKGLAAAHFNQPSLLQQNVVKQLQDRLDQGKGGAMTVEEKEMAQEMQQRPVLKHADTAPEMGHQAPPKDAKVGLLPTAEGGWEFVLLANGVWNSIKPIVKSLVIQDANAGGLGEAGTILKAWN